nr:hypothetical protein [Tanacetum cinerariifolium]
MERKHGFVRSYLNEEEGLEKPIHQTNVEEESDIEAISETFFGDQADDLNEVVDSAQQSIPKETSYDPFNIYDILNKENKEVNAAATNSSISFLPGFTPDKPDTDVGEPVAQKDQFQPDVKSVGSSSHTVESANNVDDQFSTGSIENIQKKKESGSILEILEEMISVGQTMGFSMEGSIKDMERIIDLKGADDVPGSRRTDHTLWREPKQDKRVNRVRLQGRFLGLQVKITWETRFLKFSCNETDRFSLGYRKSFLLLQGYWSFGFELQRSRQGVEDLRELLHKQMVKRMASMNTRLNVEKVDVNIVQKHGGSKQVGFKQLGLGVETGVHGVLDEKRVWFEVELQGRDREAEVFQEKEYQTGWKIKTGNVFYSCNQRSTQQCMKSEVAKHLGVAGIHQHNGLVDKTNVTLFAKLARDREQHLACNLFGYREDTNEAAFAVAGLKDDMDAQSDVYVLNNGCRKCSDNSDGYYWSIHQTLLKGYSTQSLKDNLSGDCDVKKNDVGMLDKFDRGVQTHVQVLVDFDYAMRRSIVVMARYMTFTEARKKKIWLKGLLTESGYELRLVAGIATGALVKGCS